MSLTVASSIAKATTTSGPWELPIGSHFRWQEVANENETDRNRSGLHAWICCDRYGAIAEQQQSGWKFLYYGIGRDTRGQRGWRDSLYSEAYDDQTRSEKGAHA